MAKFCSKSSLMMAIAVFIVLTMKLTVFSQIPDWFQKLNQIKISESRRQDVERIFGSPPITQVRTGNWSQTIDYKLGVGILYVYYSTGRCSQENTDGYNLDEGVVIGISLHLLKDVKISKLKLDLTTFEKYRASDTNAITYYNDEQGIDYIGDKKRIRSIKYSIGEKYNYLDCKNILKSK